LMADLVSLDGFCREEAEKGDKSEKIVF
jgi:hypothetical protein